MADETAAESDQDADESFLSNIKSVTKGAGLFGIGQVTMNVFGLLVNLVLTQVLGPGRYGFYTYANTLTGIASTLSSFGSDKTLSRLITKYEDDPTSQSGFIGLNLLLSLAVGSATAGALYITAPQLSQLIFENDGLVVPLQVLAVAVPAGAALFVVIAVFKATERLEYQVLLRNIAQPGVFLLVVLAVSFVAGTLFAIAVARAAVIVGIAVVGLALLLWRTDLPVSLPQDRASVVEYVRYAVPLSLRDVGGFLYNRADLLIVGFLVDGAAVGIYNIAFLIAGIAALPLYGFNQLFPPIASRLHTQNKTEELQAIYSTVTRWTLTLSLVLLVGGLSYPAEILRVFGEDFVAGRTVLVIIMVSEVVNAAVGPSGLMLLMTDHQKFATVNQWVFGIANVVLNVVLTLEFGIIGAAVATASTTVAQNAVRVTVIGYLEGYMPYTRAYYKPFVAAGVAAVMMWLASLALAGIPLLLLGGGAGALAYFTVLYALGIGEQERDLLQQLYREGTG